MILAFTGDIAFSKYFKEAYSNENLFSKDVVDFLNSADYTIANIEAPITNGTATAKKTLVHTSSPKSVDALKKINANVWNLSNNHAMDCGQKGLEDTMELARNNQILTLGAGLNLEKASEPLVLRKGNVRVGVLAVSYRGAVIAKEDSAGCLFWGDYKIIKNESNK